MVKRPPTLSDEQRAERLAVDPPAESKPTSYYVERAAETRRMEMKLRLEQRRQGK